MAPITQKPLTTLKSEPLPLEIGLGINASFSKDTKKEKEANNDLVSCFVSHQPHVPDDISCFLFLTHNPPRTIKRSLI